MVRVLFEKSWIRPTKVLFLASGNWRNNERRLEQSSVVRFWWELYICGWFGCYLKDVHSDLPNEARGQSWPQRSDDHSVKMISNLFQGPSPVPRGPSLAKDSEKMFQIEARGQKQWNWRNNERRLEQSSVVTFWWELHIFGWFGVLFEIYSFRPTKWGQRSKLTSEVRWPLCLNDIKSIPGPYPVPRAHPWPKILKKCFK